MNLYDNPTSASRKDPISSSTSGPKSQSQTQPLQNAYNSYNRASAIEDNENNNANTANSIMQSLGSEVVILQIIPNDDSSLNQIACILLSPALIEKESFSFHFDDKNHFESQSDYIYDTLHARTWICDTYNLQRCIETAFKSIHKASPQSINILNVQQIFNDYKVFPNMKSAINARIGCNEIYTNLQRIALFNLLLQINAEPKNFISVEQPMPSSMEQAQQTTNYPNAPIEEPLENNKDDTHNNNNDNNNDNQWTDEQNNQSTSDNITYEQIDTQNTNNETIQIQTDIINENYTYNNDDNETKDGNQENINQNDNEKQSENDINDIDDDIDNNNDTQTKSNYQQINGYIHETDNDESKSNINDSHCQPVQQNVDDSYEEKQEQTTHSQSQSPLPSSSTNVTTVTSTNSQSQSISNSWAEKFRSTKPGEISSHRRALGVIDNVSDKLSANNKAKRNKTGTVIREPDAIRNVIVDAIEKKKAIWVSYAGHQKPFIPRKIRPQSWETQQQQQNQSQTKGKAKRDTSFLALQDGAKSQTPQKFYLRYVLEVRGKGWKISQRALDALKEKYPTISYGPYASQRYNNSNNSNGKRIRNYNKYTNAKGT